jgi:hypothetical protein
VTRARPGGEEDEKTRSIPRAQGAALGWVELEQGACRRAQRAVARLDLYLAVDDYDPRSLADLVIAELLSGMKGDHDGAAVLRVEDDRIPRAAWHLDLVQAPDAHAANLTDPRSRVVATPVHPTFMSSESG